MQGQCNYQALSLAVLWPYLLRHTSTPLCYDSQASLHFTVLGNKSTPTPKCLQNFEFSAADSALSEGLIKQSQKSFIIRLLSMVGRLFQNWWWPHCARSGLATSRDEFHTSRDNFDTSRDNFDTLRDEMHTSRDDFGTLRDEMHTSCDNLDT